jgi:hypothetical protein
LNLLELLPANLLSLAALIIAILAAVFTRMGSTNRAKAAAIKLVVDGASAKLEEEIVRLRQAAQKKLQQEIINIKKVALVKEETAGHEAEILKLQRNLNTAMRERIELKEQALGREKELKAAHLEIERLKHG